MIDLQRARELLALAVHTQGPDFVYRPSEELVADYDLAGPLCRYEPVPADESLGPDDPRTRTGCLIGTALVLGGETRAIGVRAAVGAFMTFEPDMLTQAAADYFHEAQKVQDDGGTWGKALEAAERWFQLHSGRSA